MGNWASLHKHEAVQMLAEPILVTGALPQNRRAKFLRLTQP